MSKTRTITLSGRPPVRINEDDWPEVASASDSRHDGQVQTQADHKSDWFIRVRQHADGRAIIYARYEHTTKDTRETNIVSRAGVLIDEPADATAICDTIRDVAREMAGFEHYDDDAAHWGRLARECIADMPPEELD